MSDGELSALLVILLMLGVVMLPVITSEIERVRALREHMRWVEENERNTHEAL